MVASLTAGGVGGMSGFVPSHPTKANAGIIADNRSVLFSLFWG